MLLPDETQHIRSGTGTTYGSVSGQLMEVCRVKHWKYVRSVCRKCVGSVVGSVPDQFLEMGQVSYCCNLQIICVSINLIR